MGKPADVFFDPFRIFSHAAVIGREYGIPAVLNVIGATQVIKTGDRIKINGKKGLVEILEKGP